MKKIIPITDMQRQAGQIVSDLTASGEPVLITQRGRPVAVLIGADHYARIEEDLARLDELELLEMVAQARDSLSKAQTVSHREVKARLAKRQAGKPEPKRRAR